MAVTLLLSIAFCPAADLQNGAPTTPTTVLPASEAQTAAPKQTSTKQKSVLDEEVLDSPLSFLKDAFTTSEEEESDVTAQPSTLVLTVKALIATLLSTII